MRTFITHFKRFDTQRFPFAAMTFVIGFLSAALIFSSVSVSAQNNCLTPTPSTVRPTAAPDTGTRLNPVPLGSRKIVIVKPGTQEQQEFAFTFTRIIRGKEALDILLSLDKDNALPEPGTEYLLAMVDFEYVRGPSAIPAVVFGLDFWSLSAGKVRLEPPLTIGGLKGEYAPFIFQGKPGEKASGIVPAFVLISDPYPLLGYGTSASLLDQGTWFATTK